MKSLSKNKQDGFTLIEIIIALVLFAILGTVIFQYLGTALFKSSAPIRGIGQALELQQVMEKITADYDNNFTTNLNGLQNAIATVGRYDNNSGQYTVVDNVFIKFVAQAEVKPLVSGDLQDLLKVTIKSNLGGTLTNLFVCLSNCNTEP